MFLLRLIHSLTEAFMARLIVRAVRVRSDRPTQHSNEENFMARKLEEYEAPTHEEIAAYASWLANQLGNAPADDLENWLQAEAQLIADRKHDAGLHCSPASLRSRLK
jgi:hypothetical protein